LHSAKAVGFGKSTGLANFAPARGLMYTLEFFSEA